MIPSLSIELKPRVSSPCVSMSTNTSRVSRTSAGSTIAAATIESGCVVPGTPIERSNASALLVTWR